MSNCRRFLVFVRHGESEANVYNSANYANDRDAIGDLARINERIDWHQRLTPRGKEQIVKTRRAISTLFGGLAKFSALYTSPYIRARETAVILSKGYPCPRWRIDDRLCERDWGEFGYSDVREREKLYPLQNRLYDESYWAFLPSGGESTLSAAIRIRSFLADCARHSLMVAHGDIMNIVRYVIEGLTSEEFEELLEDRHENMMKNGAILAYQDHGSYLERLVYWPHDPENSPYGGEWQFVEKNRTFSPADFEDQISKYPPLL